MTNELFVIKETVSDIAAIALAKMEARKKPATDYISQRQAYAEFGEAWVKEMLDKGIVKGQRRGVSKNSHVCYSRTELLAALAALAAERALKNNFFGDIFNFIKLIG
ncbi:MAG: hypothetical protein LBV41_08825 [Cytophagaceae bacterium]|jgi:hypothetical protein|nr:hypothetical protein [Cytophagaceae bacterium]